MNAGFRFNCASISAGKPIILNFVYYKCRDLCPLLLDGIVRTLRAISFDIGDEFDVLTVSIDPHDNAALAAAQKRDFLARYGRPGSERGWHFLTGEEAAIARLASTIERDEMCTEFGGRKNGMVEKRSLDRNTQPRINVRVEAAAFRTCARR